EQDALSQILIDIDSEYETVRHDAVIRLGDLGAKGVETLVVLLKDDSPAIKDEAVNSLISIGGEDVANAVVPLFYDDEVYVSNIAVEILGRLGDVALPAVCALMNEEDDDVLKFAIDVIGVIGNTEPVSLLLPHLKHKNPNIKSAVAVTLGKLKAVNAVDDLVLLLSAEDEWVRFSALEAIGVIGGENVADKLLDMFKAVDISRIAALDALSMLAEPKDIGKVMQVVSAPGVADVLSVETVVRFIEKFQGNISDSDSAVFLHILLPRLSDSTTDEINDIFRGLAILKDKSALDALLIYAGTMSYDEMTRMYLKDAIVALADINKITVSMSQYSNQALTLVEALAELKDPATVESLVNLLETNPDKKVKRVVIEALGNIGTENTFDTLVDALSDDESKVRRNAAEALGKLGEKRAVAPLLEFLLRAEFDDVKEVIGESLSAIGGSEVEAAYVSLLDNEDMTIRVVGIEGLGGLKTDGAKQCLMKALGSDDPKIRVECIKALGLCDGDDISTILEGALKDKDKQVRMVAIEALGVRGEVKLTVNALDDEDMWVRFKVANILAENKIPESEDKLVELLKNDEIPVQVACARALGALGSKKAVETLKGLTDHSDANLKNAAKEALALCE
ncbi:MAG: HEAT repeat domain-containing protein, partial [Proteobacteria bacterium]|nr:HEAT repeat domain-containing protein [Pseudomonadota bacterium]